MSNTVYEIVTKKIIENLEKGVISWKKSWHTNKPMNFITKKAYRGINRLLLGSNEYSSPYYISFKQAQKLGGKIKKGENSHIITYWKMFENDVVDSKGNVKKKVIPMLRYYRVFNLEQTEGIKYDNPGAKVNNPIEEAEKITVNYEKQLKSLAFGGSRAYYSPVSDSVQVPNKNSFDTIENFYSTKFHELIHSTGVDSRLNRYKTGEDSFGDKEYSKEELVAEIGSAFLCGVVGIENSTIENQSAYIQGWLKALKNDCKMIIYASSKAEKAVDYIQSFNTEVK